MIRSRLTLDTLERPLLSSNLNEQLELLLENRRDHYASFEKQINVNESNIDELTWQAQIDSGAFRLVGMAKPCDVRIADNELSTIGIRFRELKLSGPIVIVTDENVGPHYELLVNNSLQEQNYRVSILRIPPGESNKHIDTVQLIWNACAEARLERTSTIVALGGGVVNDLAGFAAATFMRGVEWVTIPTTLLAMVDASIGGKTGFDLPQGKNLVGSFYPPRLVFVDPAVLNTLPIPELRSGMAEVVKHGIIADPALLDICENIQLDNFTDGWEKLISRAIAVKVMVIENDPYESGKRAVLNLGHTFGHAIETASGYKIRHGEGVSIGMVLAARLAVRLGIAQSDLDKIISDILERLGLPIDIPSELDRAEIWDKMHLDKKRHSGGLRFVLPAGIGDVRYGMAVDEQLIHMEGL